MITVWAAVLLTLAVIQKSVYNISMTTLVRASGGLWLMIYSSLIGTEIIKRFLTDAGLDWWVTIVVGFMCCLVGEGFGTVFRMEGKKISKQKQLFPSFFTFSILFLCLSWLHLSTEMFWEWQHLKIIYVSIASLVFSIFVIAFTERLRLSDVPRPWQGLPILLVTGAICLMALHGFRFLSLH